MFKMAVAHSALSEMDVCATALADEAMTKLDGGQPQAALLFSTDGLEHGQLLRGLRARLPNCAIVGGSSYGEVSGDRGYRLGTSLLILFASDRVRLRTGVVRGLTSTHPETDAGADPGADSTRIAAQLRAADLPTETPALGLLFPDGVALNLATVVQAFVDQLPFTPLFGSGTADWRVKRSYQFFNDEVLQGAVPFLLFYGPLRIGWSATKGLAAGWEPISPRLPARCTENRIKQIAGQPATDYLDTFYPVENGRWKWSACHPLAIFSSQSSGEPKLLDVCECDREQGVVSVREPVATDCEIQLTQPSPDLILSSARRTLLAAMTEAVGPAPVAGVLWLACVRRALVLGQTPERELRHSISDLASIPPLGGFYAFGEIAPARHAGKPLAESFSLIVLLLSEDPPPFRFPDLMETQDEVSMANLRRQILGLAHELREAREEQDRLQQALAAQRSLTSFATFSRSEQRVANQANALGLICALLDTRFDDLRRLALKGEPSRLNRTGLARLLDAEHRRRYGEPFPLSIAQLARLLAPNECGSDEQDLDQRSTD